MSRRFTSLLLALALVVPGLASALPTCPQPLRIGFLDTPLPPQLLGQGATFPEPPGWQVLAVRDALKRLGCKAELLRLPSRRLLGTLSQGQIDIAMLYAPTPERLRTLGFPLDARGQPDLAWAPAIGHMSLFSRAGVAVAPAGWDGRLPTGWRVGVMAGSVYEVVARERGWDIELISAYELGLSMLQARRFDLMMLGREAMPQERRSAVSEWAMVDLFPLYAPASPGLLRRHNEWTQAFWQEICRSVRRVEPDVRTVECGVLPPRN